MELADLLNLVQQAPLVAAVIGVFIYLNKERVKEIARVREHDQERMSAFQETLDEHAKSLTDSYKVLVDQVVDEMRLNREQRAKEMEIYAQTVGDLKVIAEKLKNAA